MHTGCTACLKREYMYVQYVSKRSFPGPQTKQIPMRKGAVYSEIAGGTEEGRVREGKKGRKRSFLHPETRLDTPDIWHTARTKTKKTASRPRTASMFRAVGGRPTHAQVAIRDSNQLTPPAPTPAADLQAAIMSLHCAVHPLGLQGSEKCCKNPGTFF